LGGDEGEGVAGAEEGGAADATGLGGLDGLADGDGAGGEEIIEPVDGFIESAARRGGVGEEVGEGIGRSGTTGCARGRGVGVVVGRVVVGRGGGVVVGVVVVVIVVAEEWFHEGGVEGARIGHAEHVGVGCEDDFGCVVAVRGE